MASPAIVFTNGTITTTSSEATVFEVISDKYFKTYLNLKNMIGGDTFRVKTYVWDEYLGEYVKIVQTDYSGAQDPAGKALAFDACTRYKVTIQRTAGADRAVTWLRAQV